MFHCRSPVPDGQLGPSTGPSRAARAGLPQNHRTRLRRFLKLGIARLVPMLERGHCGGWLLLIAECAINDARCQNV